jgi:hypothetical protein
VEVNANELNVNHNSAAHRFEIDLGDSTALTEYRRSDNLITFFHTEVPEAYEGQGIASKLARTALEYAKSQGLTVNPLCPFVKAYVMKHPEYKEISRL